MTESIIRLSGVQERTGLSRSEIYRLEGIGGFPKRVVLGARSVGWVESELQAWITERIKHRKPSGKPVCKPQKVAA